MMRHPEELLASGLAVIERAFTEAKAWRMFPLFSGGHDSYCACYVASQHRYFGGCVYHINTGIGSKKTRQFVESVCNDEKWELRVYKSEWTYELFIRKIGFPGSGSHGWVYNWLKDHCIHEMVRYDKSPYVVMYNVGKPKHALITGCRSQESVRRMGHVEPIKIGERSKKSGTVRRTERVWVAPCHDWSVEEQKVFMDYYGLDLNPVKRSVLGMSGECFCGAFARPGELQLIRQVVPDVAQEIARLSLIAKECKTPCIWGKKPAKFKVEVAETGPLCHTCDLRADAAGVIINEK